MSSIAIPYVQEIEKAGPFLTLPQSIMNKQMHLIYATAFYKAFKLSI
jgi:hypothetical protein